MRFCGRFELNRRLCLSMILSTPLTILGGSCSLGIFSRSKSTDETVQSEGSEKKSDQSKRRKIAGPAETEQSNIALKQAQAWNRMNELEDEVRVQREKIKLLEQGLMTGIAPSELSQTDRDHGFSLKRDHSRAAKLAKQSDSNYGEEGLPSVLGLPEKIGSDDSKDSVETTPDSYKVRVQVAKDYFQGSRFGMAVAELAGLLKEFGQKAGDGEAKLLIGRSYLGLKEFSIARSEIEAFLTLFPAHPHEPLARLELARAYYGMNLRDRSRAELAKVAKNFQGSEEAEIANNEIVKMKGTL